MIDSKDIITLGSIIGGSIAAMQALVFLGDRLWKKPKEDPTDQLIRELIDRLGANPQSVQCGQQHQMIATSLNGHLSAIKELAETMQGMQRTMSEQLRADELRYELMLEKLSVIGKGQEDIKAKLDRMS